MRYNTQAFNRLDPDLDFPCGHQFTESLMGWAVDPLAFRFPRLAYNRQPFNRPLQTEENIMIGANLQERLIGWLKIGADYNISHRVSEQMFGDMRIAAGSRIQAAIIESLTGTALGVTGQEISSVFAETLEGHLHVGADIQTGSKILEHLIGTLHVGANIYLACNAVEDLAGILHMGADIFLSQSLYEILNGYADIRNIAESITIITNPIPPGAVLVIDSASYTMTLREGLITKDVIHWHRGDWIKVGRGTISLTLSGIGSNSYDWEVFYHALYL